MAFSNLFKGINDFFSITSPISSSSETSTPDVLNTQNALASLGHATPDVGESLKSFRPKTASK